MSQEEELRNAVKRVIDQNLSIGYRPSRFIGATEDGRAPHIVEICEHLLTNSATLEHIEHAVKTFKNLLTLEDEVTQNPTGFGLSEAARESAQKRVEYFRMISTGRRH